MFWLKRLAGWDFAGQRACCGIFSQHVSAELPTENHMPEPLTARRSVRKGQRQVREAKNPHPAASTGGRYGNVKFPCYYWSYPISHLTPVLIREDRKLANGSKCCHRRTRHYFSIFLKTWLILSVYSLHILCPAVLADTHTSPHVT